MTAVGLKGLGDRWNLVARGGARKIAISILHRDLVYNIEIMELITATDLADRFLAPLPGSGRAFTNLAVWGRSRSGHSASDSTFDTGICVLTRSRVGLLWVGDED